MAIKGDFQLLWDSYPFRALNNPGDNPKDVTWLKQKIGGRVNDPAFKNLCAVRMSYAFNRAGLKLPLSYQGRYFKDPMKLLPGSDGYIYAVSVIQMRHYLEETYGRPDHIYGKYADKKFEIQEMLSLKQGIIIFLVKWDDADGHITLWDGVEYADNGYLEEAYSILFWEVSPTAKQVRRISGINLNDSITIRGR